MLGTLKDSDLNQKIKNLAEQERKITQDVIASIAEVDRRQLFLRMGYPSLYAYLTLEIRYSEGAAQRRIDAARLFHKVPEVLDESVQGSINLSQISKMQKAVRQIKKESGVAVSLALQKIVLENLENKNSVQSDLVLAKEFQIEIKTEEKKKTQRDESVRVELTFSKEEMKLLEEARALLSHKTGGNLKDTLIEMAKKTIHAHQPKVKTKGSAGVLGVKVDVEAKTQQASAKEIRTAATASTAATSTATATAATASTAATSTAATTTTTSTATAAVKSPPRWPTLKLKREILRRHQGCQFKDPNTGKLCGSRFFLEVDHIRPRFVGGSNESENLRALCKNHNLFRYREGI